MTPERALSTLVDLIPAFADPDSPMNSAMGIERVTDAIEADFGCVFYKEQLVASCNCDGVPGSEMAKLANATSGVTSFNGTETHIVSYEMPIGSGLRFGSATPFNREQVLYVTAIGELFSVAFENRQAFQKERHLARHDGLTGLANRSQVEMHIHEKLVSEGSSVTVFFVDLDRFKLTNDTLGHKMGDQVLKLVGSRLANAARDEDLVGRLAGDEFVVVCESMPESKALEFAVRVQKAIGIPVQMAGQSHVITASIGVANAFHGDSAEAIVANADIAMYRAKQRGRSRVELFDTALRTAIERRLAIDRDLREALEQDQLGIRLQPLVELPSRKLVGFEALVRWDHPVRGLVMPNDFIQLSEEIGLSPEVDKAVITKAFEVMNDWGRPIPVAFNLSAPTFADPNLVWWLQEAMETYGISPELVKAEITETSLMEDIGEVAKQVEALRSLGVHVWLDDFGTGYSPLTHLQTFELEGVKIDRSFVSRLGTNKPETAIVGAVFHMANALGLSVVAEGIETESQIEELLKMAAENEDAELLAQGYLFGQPATVEAAAEMAKTGILVTRSW